jgi:hypothetical protein
MCIFSYNVTNKLDLRIRFCLVLELQAQFGECYKKKMLHQSVCVCSGMRIIEYWTMGIHEIITNVIIFSVDN